MKIVAMIPARLGSNRLKKKNLLKIKDKSLVKMCIEKCIEANCFTNVVLNSESEEILSEANGICETFLRDKDKADSVATSEDFIRDFIKKYECDYLFQIHTIAPMLVSQDITHFVKSFIESGNQVGLCYEEIILETLDHKNNPINFSFNKKQNSQDLKSLKKINWSMTAWKTEEILQEKCLSFGTNRYLHRVPKLSGFVIKTMEDYLICKKIMENK